ncbi:MAG: hypothetical protein ACQEQU_00745 [Spirochaetota bacterium]
MENKVTQLLTVFLFIAMVTACTQGSYSIINGTVDFAQDSASGSYSKFNGYKERLLTLEEGAALTVSFSAETQAGDIQVELLGTDKQTLSVLEAGDKEQVTIPAEGKYRVRVTADDHAGAFALSWEIQ